MSDYEVHPAADVWPMIPADEMQELAESIKTKGQMEPIVIHDGMIIDGRNRLAACEIAGVEPVFTELEGDVDPIDYIEVHNHNRRHMTLGARTMAVIKMRPEKEKGGRGKKLSLNRDSLTKAERNNRSKARTVLAELPAADVDAVINGAKPLNEAYREAVTKREAKNDPSKLLADLQERAPDLALRVTEDGMDLGESIAACEKRESDERANRAAAFSIVSGCLKSIQDLNRGGTERLRLVAGRKDEFETHLGMKVSEVEKIVSSIDVLAKFKEVLDVLEDENA